VTTHTAPPARTVRVWDPLVRLGPWTLVLCVLTAWLTRPQPGPWHEWLGYAAVAVVVVRVVWGWCGSPHARFRDFVHGPRATLCYARAVLVRSEPATLGHNPLGGWMVVALLLTVALVCASGWLYTTDRFWGVEWVETLHASLTNLLILLVVLHVAGVVFTSWRHRENLVAAMWHGRKRWAAAQRADSGR
jgi:cytochrome b